MITILCQIYNFWGKTVKWKGYTDTWQPAPNGLSYVQIKDNKKWDILLTIAESRSGIVIGKDTQKTSPAIDNWSATKLP